MGEEDFSSSTGGIAHIDLVHSTVSRTLSGATIQGLAVGGDGKLYFRTCSHLVLLETASTIRVYIRLRSVGTHTASLPDNR